MVEHMGRSGVGSLPPLPQHAHVHVMQAVGGLALFVGQLQGYAC